MNLYRLLAVDTRSTIRAQKVYAVQKFILYKDQHVENFCTKGSLYRNLICTKTNMYRTSVQKVQFVQKFDAVHRESCTKPMTSWLQATHFKTCNPSLVQAQRRCKQHIFTVHVLTMYTYHNI